MSEATTPTGGPERPQDHYAAAEAAARAEAERLERRAIRVSRIRTFAFFVMAGPLLLLETSSRDLWPILIAAGSVGLVIFVSLVRIHRRVRRSVARARLRETLNAEGLARIHRTWDRLPPAPIESAPPDHPSAGDLDLVGRASLSHLIGRVVTAPGRAVLRELLLDPFTPLPADGAELLGRIRNDPPPPASEPGSGWEVGLRERQDAVSACSRKRRPSGRSWSWWGVRSEIGEDLRGMRPRSSRGSSDPGGWRGTGACSSVAVRSPCSHRSRS